MAGERERGVRDLESIFPAMCNSNDFAVQHTAHIFLFSCSLCVAFCCGNMFSEGTRFKSKFE